MVNNQNRSNAKTSNEEGTQVADLEAEREDLCNQLDTLDGKLAASHKEAQELAKQIKGLQEFADG